MIICKAGRIKMYRLDYRVETNKIRIKKKTRFRQLKDKE